MRSASPHLVAHVGSISKSHREIIEVALRRANDRTALDLRVFAVRGVDHTPTPRGLWVPLTDLRAFRRLLAEADAKAVELGLLPEGGEQ